MTRDLYRSISVWVRIDDTSVACYRCFELLSTGEYTVQSKDYFSIPFDELSLAFSARQFLELLVEVAPAERAVYTHR